MLQRQERRSEERKIYTLILAQTEGNVCSDNVWPIYCLNCIYEYAYAYWLSTYVVRYTVKIRYCYAKLAIAYIPCDTSLTLTFISTDCRVWATVPHFVYIPVAMHASSQQCWRKPKCPPPHSNRRNFPSILWRPFSRHIKHFHLYGSLYALPGAVQRRSPGGPPPSKNSAPPPVAPNEVYDKE